MSWVANVFLLCAMQAIRDMRPRDAGGLKTTVIYLQRLEVQTTGNLGAALLRYITVYAMQL
jgi:hypothetical protein